MTTIEALRWPALEYRWGELHFEDVRLSQLAEACGTPAYIYSRRVLCDNYRAYEQALEGRPHLVCYAMKANGNLALLRILAELGAGLDIVSGGELYRARRAGVPADRIIFSGVSKTDREIEEALTAGILMFNVESAQELSVIADIAGRLGKVARIALRVNPDIDPGTHPKITTGMKTNKFGIDVAEVHDLYLDAARDPRLSVVGIQAHIGSQITSRRPHHDACERLCALLDKLRAEGVVIRYLSLGGGLGITYHDEQPPEIGAFVADLCAIVGDRDVTLIMEPGRSLVGHAGVLLSRVLYTKSNDCKNFVMMDAGMTDLIRPSIYDAYHPILPLRENNRPPQLVDVVGPICESTDVLARNRHLPQPRRGDVLAILCAGAYGFCMASNYNDHPRPCEILIEGDRWRLVRARETYEDLVRGEE